MLAPMAAEVPYCNPVHDEYFADPFVLRVDDGYLAVGTGRVVDGRVFEVLHSPDLVSWRSVGGALVPPEGVGTDFWAPEVIEIDGRWTMYYSVGTGDVGHHLRVAVADRPEGPYVDEGVDLTPHEGFAIDPHPLRAQDGGLFLFYARDVLEGERVGTMLAVAPLLSPTSLGPAVDVLLASADWQIFERQRHRYGRVVDWHTLEGPFVVFRDGRYWCFYSAGSWEQPTYAVGCAVSDHPLGPWVEADASRRVLQSVPGHVTGPGHNSLVRTADDVDVLVYHAWDEALTRRQMRVDQVWWTDQGPRTDGPTWEPTTLPRRPGPGPS
jgi:arabinan endo-1,5-alpha-L-arabinosidase